MLWSQVLEIGLLALAVCLWIRRQPNAAFGAALLLVVLCALQYVNHMPAEEVPTSQNFAVMGLVAYSFLAFGAWVVERWRREDTAAA